VDSFANTSAPPVDSPIFSLYFYVSDFICKEKKTMVFRALLLVAVSATISACSSTSSTDGSRSGDMQYQNEQEAITGTAVDGLGSFDRSIVDGPAPGTQQDLVVNVGDRVFFGYDRFDLTPEARDILQMQAQWVQQYPNLTITIEGHCDERGTREYNLALGEKRANAVKNYLRALGVPDYRVNVISYGKERPAVLGSNPSAWAQNRRGVTVID
jgi:peptidoglycan-associated lipoprotein